MRRCWRGWASWILRRRLWRSGTWCWHERREQSAGQARGGADRPGGDEVRGGLGEGREGDAAHGGDCARAARARTVAGGGGVGDGEGDRPAAGGGGGGGARRQEGRAGDCGAVAEPAHR